MTYPALLDYRVVIREFLIYIYAFFINVRSLSIISILNLMKFL